MIEIPKEKSETSSKLPEMADQSSDHKFRDVLDIAKRRYKKLSDLLSEFIGLSQTKEVRFVVEVIQGAMSRCENCGCKATIWLKSKSIPIDFPSEWEDIDSWSRRQLVSQEVSDADNILEFLKDGTISYFRKFYTYLQLCSLDPSIKNKLLEKGVYAFDCELILPKIGDSMKNWNSEAVPDHYEDNSQYPPNTIIRVENPGFRFDKDLIFAANVVLSQKPRLKP